jgi:hypothetical protein
MVISDAVKKKAGAALNKIAAKADALKVQKQSSGNEKISQIVSRIKTLKGQGGFEGTIERLESQKALILNQLKNQKKQ